jgi:threonyl-tRNA synthetase
LNITLLICLYGWRRHRCGLFRCDDFSEYGLKVKGLLEEGGIRAELDRRSETLNKKIRQAELEKIPYVLVVG